MRQTHIKCKMSCSEVLMPKQIGNGKHKFFATGYCRRIQQTLSNSFLWSFVVKYFGEAVSRPGQLPPSVPLSYATESAPSPRDHERRNYSIKHSLLLDSATFYIATATFRLWAYDVNATQYISINEFYFAINLCC